MAFNWPISPTEGQIYTPAGGPTYSWNGVAWQAVVQGVPVTVYVSDTAPPSPAIGQLWWDSDSGTMAIWYADADSAQWVQVSGEVSAKGPAFIQRQVITATGALTLHADTRVFFVEVKGGGGAGGGAQPGPAGNGAAGGGGGAGGYTNHWYTRTGSTAITLAIGGGGAGNSGGAGGAGTNSTFTDGTTLLTGLGGAGAPVSGTSTVVTGTGAAGGSASGGTLNIIGESGDNAFGFNNPSSSGVFYVSSGAGGSSIYGARGKGITSFSSTSTGGTGTNAGGFGAGGGGGWVVANGTVAGGNGSSGVIIVTEYR